MGRRIKLVTLLVSSLVALALFAAIIAARYPTVQVKLPTPNGFDDLVRAAQTVQGEYEELNKISTNELRTLVQADTEALKIARIGLHRECRVLLPASANSFVSHMEPIGRMRTLAHAFIAEGRLAELTEHPESAADSYLDALLLGQQMSKGGIMIHQMVGISFEMMAAGRLQNLLPRLDATSCRHLAAKLEAIENNREPVEEVVQTEHQWSRHAVGFREQIVNLLNFRQMRQLERRHIARVQTQTIKSRELAIALASRAFELETGKRPDRLDDLVPAYLKAVPVDPVTGTNMSYLP